MSWKTDYENASANHLRALATLEAIREERAADDLAMEQRRALRQAREAQALRDCYEARGQLRQLAAQNGAPLRRAVPA